MISYFKTNKQLRAINAHLIQDAELQAKHILSYRKEIEALKRQVKTYQTLQDAQTLSSKPFKSPTKAPVSPVKAPKPVSRYTPATSPYQAPEQPSVRPEPSHDVAAFLAGGITGLMVSEIFSSNDSTNTDTSSSSSSSDSYSGGGGDFSGGGASGDF